jgi:hypothetical protein
LPYGKTNYRPDTVDTPKILQNAANLQKIAALGSFIFVKGGSLYEEMKRQGLEVKPGDHY